MQVSLPNHSVDQSRNVASFRSGRRPVELRELACLVELILASAAGSPGELEVLPDCLVLRLAGVAVVDVENQTLPRGQLQPFVPSFLNRHEPSPSAQLG